VTAGNGQAVVSWKAPANDGGLPITGYAVFTSGRSDLTVFTDEFKTTATVTGLSNGTSYTFTVVAFNELGVSAASAVSSAVTPRLVAATATTPRAADPASSAIPLGAPSTGAGGASSSSDGPLAGLGGLALLLAGAAATQVVRRRRLG
jgi:hypothetical protein